MMDKIEQIYEQKDQLFDRQLHSKLASKINVLEKNLKATIRNL